MAAGVSKKAKSMFAAAGCECRVLTSERCSLRRGGSLASTSNHHEHHHEPRTPVQKAQALLPAGVLLCPRRAQQPAERPMVLPA